VEWEERSAEILAMELVVAEVLAAEAEMVVVAVDLVQWWHC